MENQDLPHAVIRACLQVHATLGSGLIRDAYEDCLAVELRAMELPYERGRSLDFTYRGQSIKGAARLDFIIEESLLVRILAADSVTELDRRSMETWLKLSGLKTGLIVNFQVAVLRKGIHRVSLKRRETSD